MRPLSSPAPQVDLGRRVSKLTAILEVAKAFAKQRDIDSLLPVILSEAAAVVEADRCSLFILDRAQGVLWSKLAQGAATEIRLPLGSGIAGMVAKTGETINIPDAYADERFNRSFDVSMGYRTHSIVCVPMRDADGGIAGVLQALNKRDGRPFDAEDEEILIAMGGQAASAIENALLHEEISRLFEGFVSASVTAIESRDPTTAGHSSRVAALTVELAQCLEHVSQGPYARTSFSPEEIQEIRYASLLHDFGKVGVREDVLVKATKLYPHELELLRMRFQLARKDRELESHQRRLAGLKAHGAEAWARLFAEEDERLKQAIAELEAALEFVLSCNRPTVLAEGGFERLSELGSLSYLDPSGHAVPLVSPQDIRTLSIPKGSLSETERKEIESHVTHTFRFLSLIPWTRALRRVPEIAFAHHEKLDGTGYPRSVPSAAIPLQSKMMSICDIYDALTASDRPYKKAVPNGLALDILKKEVEAGQLDSHLFQVFVEGEVTKRAFRAR